MDHEAEMLKKILGERLSLLRAESDLTQTEVSAGSGVSISSVSQYETCARGAQAVSIIKLARFFNVTLDYMMGVSDERYPK